MKELLFHINHQAYTIDLSEDSEKKFENGLKKFLNNDNHLSTEDLLLAYMNKTQELIELETKLQEIVDTSPILNDEL